MLEKYRVEGILGKGGMSVVYQGKRVLDGKTVALKVAKDAKDQEVLKGEYQILQELRHHGIVEALDFCQTEEEAVLVLERIQGEDLRKKLTRERFFSAEQVRRWGIALVCILAYLHEQSVWYLDLKPSNVMCLPDGRLVLIDFGAAIRQGRRRERKLGTRGYAAPEFLRAGVADEGSDRYSLGAMLYQLWTGQLYEGTLPEGDSFLIPILRRCLAESPGLRYRTEAELLRDLLEGRAGSRRRWRRSLLKVSAAGMFCLVMWASFGALQLQKHVVAEQLEDSLLEASDSRNLCLLFPEKPEGYELYLKECGQDGQLDHTEEMGFLELCQKVPEGENQSCLMFLERDKSAYKQVCRLAGEMGMLYGSWEFAGYFLQQEQALEKSLIARRESLLDGSSESYDFYWKELMEWYQETGIESTRRILREAALFFGGFSREIQREIQRFWEEQAFLDCEEWKLLEALFSLSEGEGL